MEDVEAPEKTYPADPALPPLDSEQWLYKRFYMPLARTLARYHRVYGTPLSIPKGPCIYTMRHGFSYLSLDYLVAAYLIGWHERRYGTVRPIIAMSNIIKTFPALKKVKIQVGGVEPNEKDMLAALRAGYQIIVTPGGSREAQPRWRDPYKLRWENRFGFVKLAMRAGVPLVPLATVGGHKAWPGFRIGKLSIWSPLPLPARLQVELGEPIMPPPGASADNPDDVRALHQQVWDATQALYNKLLQQG